MTATTAPRPMPHTSWPTDRSAIAAGYRHIADLIETGQVPIPMNINVSFPVRQNEGTDQAAAAADLRRALGGGHWEKKESSDGGYLYLVGMCGGLPVQVWMDRDAVCKRVVVGTETVEIPALPAIEARTETREIVQWVCSPLLENAEAHS